MSNNLKPPAHARCHFCGRGNRQASRGLKLSTNLGHTEERWYCREISDCTTAKVKKDTGNTQPTMSEIGRRIDGKGRRY